MNEFKASNGMTVERDHNDDVVIGRGTGSVSVFMADGTALALREFFQHERDEELGRWRSPSAPTWTAVRRNTCIYFQNEDHERSFHFVPKLEASIKSWSPDLQALAYEYIEAHPERKAWEDAKPGEVWVLTFDGAVDTFKAYESRYGTTYFTRSRETSTGLADERITAGRRIWPEDAS
jgi:hypothetical protein